MSPRLRRVCLATLLVVVAALAWAPLLGAGPVGEDLPTLIGIAALRDGYGLGDLYRVPGIEGEPLAAWTLVLGQLLSSAGGRWSPEAVRVVWIVNGFFLLLAAWALTRVVRRGFQPWMGVDQARAAGRSSALLLVAHPLCAVSVARVASRGDLMALALGLASLALFLVGRQRGRYDKVAAAAALAIVLPWASRLAAFLPLAAAGLEYASARRHRGQLARLRTASNTLFVFALCVVLGSAVARAFPVEAGAVAWEVAASPFDVPAPDEGGALGPLLIGLEKLGVLVLPVNTRVLGPVGYVPAALAFLAALHPAFHAGRAAPRTWGWILAAWLVATLVSQWPDRHQRVRPETLEFAHSLLVAAVVMAAGLGIAATALSGVRRLVVPLAVVTGYAMLAHVVNLPREEAGQTLELLAEDLARAAREHGEELHYVVVDPPREVEGVRLFGVDLADLGEPCLRATLPDLEPEARDVRDLRPLSVRGIAAAALSDWARQPEFDALRAEGLVLIVPPEHLPPDASAKTPPRTRPFVLRLPPAQADAGRRNWRGEGRSPSGMQLDPLLTRALAVEAAPGTAADEPPVVHWSAAAGVREGSAAGAWIGSSAKPVAVFDLGARFEWLVGARVRSLWLGGALSSLAFAEVLPEVQALDGHLEPARAGDDWVFELTGTIPPEALAGEASWALVLFESVTRTRVELTVVGEGAPRIHAASRLRVPGADLRVRHACERAGGPVVWTLERRVDGLCVARTSGRVHGSRESRARSGG